MEKMLGYCGLDCLQCPAYKASQAGDQEALEQTAAMWREQFNSPQITAESIVCDGCKASGRLSAYCHICEISKCAQEHGLETCAPCADYGCDKLAGFLEHAPEARQNLEALRKA